MFTLGFPDGSIGKESACSGEDTGDVEFNSWVGKIPWRRKWQPTPVLLRESPWTEMATHSSTLEGNSMDRGDWQATVHGVAKSQTQLSMHVYSDF